MVRESNSPGTSAPTVLAGLRLYRTAHHPCQCFQYGAHRPNLDKPGACAPAAFGTVAFDRSATTPLIRTKEQTGRRIRADLVLPVGFEPTTIRLELFCSGPLSYGSKVDACFGSRKSDNPFPKEVIRFFGILLLPRHPRFPPSFRAWSADTTVFAMLRLHMALCHASCFEPALIDF